MSVVEVEVTEYPQGFVAEAMEPVAKLSREIRAVAANLDRESAGFLVDMYYRLQEHRIALGNQSTSLAKLDKPIDVLDHFYTQLGTLERQVVSALDVWSNTYTVGMWARGQLGIGPVLSAGLLAHIDIEQAPSVGHIWRFAGLDPTTTWGKGEKRPYNADLKVLCWKIGDSFVKVSGRENAYYGKVYRDRKDYEVGRNERGELADQAAATLEAKKIRDPATRKVYEAGQLPPGRIDLRARRYAVKLFLAHWHEVAYVERYGVAPPLPYPIAHLGHAHKIEVPDPPF